jgi:hypothetical protein
MEMATSSQVTISGQVSTGDLQISFPDGSVFTILVRQIIPPAPEGAPSVDTPFIYPPASAFPPGMSKASTWQVGPVQVPDATATALAANAMAWWEAPDPSIRQDAEGETGQVHWRVISTAEWLGDPDVLAYCAPLPRCRLNLYAVQDLDSAGWVGMVELRQPYSYEAITLISVGDLESVTVAQQTAREIALAVLQGRLVEAMSTPDQKGLVHSVRFSNAGGKL